MIVWSIGHSTHPIEEFIDLLELHEIQQLADIRTAPHSRRHPQFDKAALKKALGDNDIAYEHIKALGGWRRPQQDSPNTGWRIKNFQGYADYALTDEFAQALTHLRDLATKNRTAMMCSEALWWQCHRRLVADRLTLAGDEVRHIGPDGSITVHELTPFARVEQGQLIYPPPDEAQQRLPLDRH